MNLLSHAYMCYLVCDRNKIGMIYVGNDVVYERFGPGAMRSSWR